MALEESARFCTGRSPGLAAVLRIEKVVIDTRTDSDRGVDFPSYQKLIRLKVWDHNPAMLSTLIGDPKPENVMVSDDGLVKTSKRTTRSASRYSGCRLSCPKTQLSA